MNLLIALFFFFNDTATPEIYTLSLHDALPIFPDQPRVAAVAGEVVRDAAPQVLERRRRAGEVDAGEVAVRQRDLRDGRSEEHTSELQSRQYLVCRLLLEKKKEAGSPAH